LPSLSDFRLPNPIDPGIFCKACLLHAGTVRLEAIG
jgi:hypothetical protein